MYTCIYLIYIGIQTYVHVHVGAYEYHKRIHAAPPHVHAPRTIAMPCRLAVGAYTRFHNRACARRLGDDLMACASIVLHHCAAAGYYGHFARCRQNLPAVCGYRRYRGESQGQHNSRADGT